jgi:hypothetical protein
MPSITTPTLSMSDRKDLIDKVEELKEKLKDVGYVSGDGELDDMTKMLCVIAQSFSNQDSGLITLEGFIMAIQSMAYCFPDYLEKLKSAGEIDEWLEKQL